MLNSQRFLHLILLLMSIVLIDFIGHASITDESVLLFERSTSPPNWKQQKRAQSDIRLTLHLALVQHNLDDLEKAFWRVSDPKSSEYGQFWNTTAIMNLIGPPKEDIKNVFIWLEEAGFKSYSVIDAPASYQFLGDSIRLESTVHYIETLFQTQLYRFVHKNDHSMVIAAMGKMLLPVSIFPNIIAFVTGLSDFPLNTRSKLHQHKYQNTENAIDKGVIAPEVLLRLYNISNHLFSNSGSNVSQCVAEFLGSGSFESNDLKQFYTLGDIPKPTSPITYVGPNIPDEGELEASLDIEYVLATGRGVKTWYWTEPIWMYDFAVSLFNKKNGPDVVSMSYQWIESEECSSPTGQPNPTCAKIGVDSRGYVERTNTEFMKIGLKGVTLLASSGDEGAPGESGCKGKPLAPGYPATSPYVTTVGGTMLAKTINSGKTSVSPVCKQNKCATSSDEIVCSYPQSGITSGGGFSNYSPRPSYQNDVVNAYLQKMSSSLPPASKFNASGRAYPDVAAAANNYAVWMGMWMPTDGTSASTPVWAGIVSLLNQQREKDGNSLLGFLNPLLYDMAQKHPVAFRDVTKGNNKCTSTCCGDLGFLATEGWDPTTGLGTPNVAQMVHFIRQTGRPKSS